MKVAHAVSRLHGIDTLKILTAFKVCKMLLSWIVVSIAWICQCNHLKLTLDFYGEDCTIRVYSTWALFQTHLNQKCDICRYFEILLIDSGHGPSLSLFGGG